MLLFKLSRILFLFTIILLTIHLIIHYYASLVKVSNQLSASSFVSENSLESWINSDLFENEITLSELERINKIENLSHRIREMLRIRGSVKNELKYYEGKRQKLNSELLSLSFKLDQIKSQFNRKINQLNHLLFSIVSASDLQKEAIQSNLPFISRPLQLLPISSSNLEDSESNKHIKWENCQMNYCFDYSRCSLTSNFLAYLYEPQSSYYDDSESVILNSFKSSLHITSNPSSACVFIVLLFTQTDISNLNSYLTSLSHWSSYGYNHIIINLNSKIDVLETNVNPAKALIMQSKFNRNTFRSEFDTVIAPFYFDDELYQNFGKHCPARRQYLATFYGSINQNQTENHILSLIKALKEIQSEADQDKFDFRFNCINKCKEDNFKFNSTFVLIFPPSNVNLISHPDIISDLFNTLTSGAVPVLLGGDYLKLPFFETIDWSKAIISVPVARVTELHYILKSFSDNDIIELRRHGKLLLQRYFSSSTLVNTMVSFIRQKRLNIPALPIPDVYKPTFYNDTVPIRYSNESYSSVYFDSLDESLGPVEPPFPSITYQRNISLTFCRGYDLWNTFQYNPFNLYPNSPFDPVLPSEAKFVGSSYGFRPIGMGSNSGGKEFRQALGGNIPREQFTIIMLTYEREKVLMSSIARLKGMPYLNKLLLIWNNPKKPPSPDLKWPDIGVPIHVIQTSNNSLNNRFKPYHYIETEAILSLDDDTFLRQDEIIFAFRYNTKFNLKLSLFCFESTLFMVF